MTDKEIKEVVETVNKIRKVHKDRWYYYTNNKFGISLKGYNSWIQLITRGEFRDGSPMKQSMREYKAWLKDWLEKTDKHVATQSATDTEATEGQ